MKTYRLGRFLQLAGLLILPFSIVSQLDDKVGLGQSMLISAAAHCCSIQVTFFRIVSASDDRHVLWQGLPE